MLDVHVLTLPTSRPDWLSQCVDSVYEAAKAADFPVGVHLVDGDIGHIGRGRARGYAMGDHPYVTYVDHDDYLLPNAFAVLGESMRSGAESVAPGEIHERNGYRYHVHQRHHLIAYRRSIAEGFNHAAWHVCGDLALATNTSGIQIPDCVYVHRVYESPGRLLRRKRQDELRRAWSHA